MRRDGQIRLRYRWQAWLLRLLGVLAIVGCTSPAPEEPPFKYSMRVPARLVARLDTGVATRVGEITVYCDDLRKNLIYRSWDDRIFVVKGGC